MAFLRAGFRGLCLLSMLASAAACDGGPGTGEEGGSAPLDTAQVQTFDAFVQRLAEAYCDRLVVPCCADTKPIPRGECISLLQPDLQKELLEEGGGTYLPQVGAACIVAFDKLACGHGNDPSVAVCETIFERTARPGKGPKEVCQKDEDCGAPANGRGFCGDGYCSSDGSCSVTTCTVQIEVAPGEACSPTRYPASSSAPPPVDDGYLRTCPPDHVCDFDSGVCKQPPKAGEPCDLECARGSLCTGKICRALLPEGAACADKLECASFECAGGTCVARPVQVCPLAGAE